MEEKLARVRDELDGIIREMETDAGEEERDFIVSRDLPVLSEAVDTFGRTHQVIKCIEELGELTQALSKWLNGHDYILESVEAHVREEIADVQLTLFQMEVIFGHCGEIEGAKYSRLKSLIAEKKQEEERYRSLLLGRKEASDDGTDS